ncbi:hypothetical protein [Actinophytocola sp.]|uniref:hypothetical protein n=1 Tax=Actinophytocola sp. TaxID=1872138 RepID=UPI002ED81213
MDVVYPGPCPLLEKCERCGTESGLRVVLAEFPDLAYRFSDNPAGQACATLCAGCRELSFGYLFQPYRVAELVKRHEAHLRDWRRG